MIFVFPLGVPITFMALLWHHREAISRVPDIDDKGDTQRMLLAQPTLASCAFLWQPYKRSHYYW